MAGFVTTLVVGIVICFLGIRNMKGDISSLHSYHRNHVKDEDVKPFGKLVGIGTIIIGVATAFLGAFIWVSEEFSKPIFMTLGFVIFVIGMVIGMAITFYAMKKYNGGIIR